MAEVPTRDLLRVGDLRVDPEAGTVHRGAEEIVLPRLSYALLLALLEAAPGIVSHDRLLDTVWHGVTVNDETVKQRVRLLREALGDSSSSPRYVATVRGRGYRIADTVVRGEARAEPPSYPRAGRWTVTGVVATVIVIAAVAAMGWAFLASGPATRPVSIEPRRLAVLPFEHLSGGTLEPWFVRGIHAELITRLGQRSDLIVSSRETVSRLTSSASATPIAVAQRLAVDAILKGSVRREDQRIRVAVRLIDRGSGSQVWAETFDRDLDVQGVLAIQRDIAVVVADRLRLRPREGYLARLPTRDLEAYRNQLLARHLLWQMNRNDLPRSRTLFQRATEIDPQYADAWVGLGWAWTFSATSYGDMIPREAYGLALTAADRALAQQPSHVEARSLRVHLQHWYEWDTEGAERAFRALIRDHPKHIGAYMGLSFLLSSQGRHEAALGVIAEAVALQPADPWVLANVGWRHYYAGDARRAEEMARRCLQVAADYIDGQDLLASAHMLQGAYDRCSERKLAIGGHVGAAICEARSGAPHRARRLIEQRSGAYALRPAGAYHVAALHAALDDVDGAFAWLQRAVEERSREVLFVDVDPVFAGLRGDPRREAILRISGQIP